MSSIEVFSSPMSKQRDDRGVKVTGKNQDGDSMTKRTSNLMFGYNKDKNGDTKINLPNGEFISYEDFTKAVDEFVKKGQDKEAIIIAKKTGKKIDINDLQESLKKALKDKNKIILEEQVANIKNQKAPKVSIQDDKKLHENRGVFMLGNEIQLPNGEYVFKEELEQALKNYVMMIPKKEKTPVIPIITPIQKKEEPQEIIKKVKFIEKVRHNIVVPVAVFMALTAASMVGKTTIVENKQQQRAYTETTRDASVEVVQQIQQEQEDEYNKIKETLMTGENVYLEEGTRYYSNSSTQNATEGVIGNNLRPEGEYKIEYIALVDKNNPTHIYKTEFQEGVNIYDFVNNAIKENNIDINDTQIMLHIGNGTCGWVNIEDIINSQNNNKDKIEAPVQIEKNYSTEVENYQNGPIAISTDEGEVTLNVVDENNNLLKKGSKVIGSDGKEYIIDNINIETKDTTKVETTNIQEEKEKTTFSFKNITPAKMAIIAGGTVLAELATRKKFKEEIIATKKEIEEYENYQRGYLKVSPFAKLYNATVAKFTGKPLKNYTAEITKEKVDAKYYKDEKDKYHKTYGILTTKESFPYEIKEEVSHGRK